MNRKSTKRNVPGFWTGFSSMLGKKSSIRHKNVSDWEAMGGDWVAVGRDLRIAMDKYKASCK